MYLVDTMLYNKLTFKDNPSVAWINQTPMNPNIHIHNKHTPPPSTPPAPSSPLPGSPPQLPPATLTPSSNTTSTVLRAPPHKKSHIQPGVDFLKQIYDSDDSEVIKNNEQQNVKVFRDEVKQKQ